MAVYSTLKNQNFRTQTPKGDGNLIQKISGCNENAAISEHKPRKGTETEKIPVVIGILTNIFQNTNPERGRKLTFHRQAYPVWLKFQNTNPERGRKPPINPVFCTGLRHQSQNTNPERGRKLESTKAHLAVLDCQFQNTTPERGRKHRAANADELRGLEISEHKPRKGTAWEMIPFRWNHLFCLYIVFTDSFCIC